MPFLEIPGYLMEPGIPFIKKAIVFRTCLFYEVF